MKKRKKLTALALSVVAAATVLTACTGGGTEQQTENGESAVETTENETGDTETAEADAVDESIIPLYKAEYESQIREIAPADLLYFDNFCKYFPVSLAETDDNGREVYKFDSIDSFELKYPSDKFEEYMESGHIPSGTDPDTVTTTELSFKYDQLGNLDLYTTVDGNTDEVYNFVPLYYNESKGCFAGYKFTKGDDGWDEPALTEAYYDCGFQNPVSDPGEYGFTTVPSADTMTGDELIPLFKAELADEIMTVSPAELCTFEKFSYYYPVREVITDENGFFIYEIENESPLEMRDFDYFKNIEDGGVRYDVDYYFYGKADGTVITNHWLVDGYSDEELDSQVIEAKDYFSSAYERYTEVGRPGFLPLYFNKTKGCFVGYEPIPSEDWFSSEVILNSLPPEYNGTGYSIMELYYDSYGYGGNEFSVNPALYGLK